MQPFARSATTEFLVLSRNSQVVRFPRPTLPHSQQICYSISDPKWMDARPRLRPSWLVTYLDVIPIPVLTGLDVSNNFVDTRPVTPQRCQAASLLHFA